MKLISKEDIDETLSNMESDEPDAKEYFMSIPEIMREHIESLGCFEKEGEGEEEYYKYGKLICTVR